MAVKKILSVLESMRDSSLQVSFVCTLINWTHFCFHFLKWHIFLSSPFTSGQSSSTCCGLSGQGQMSPDLRVKVPDTPLGTEVEQGTALNSSSQGAPFSGKETPTPSALVLMMRRKQHNTLLLLLSHFSRVRLCDPIDSSPPGSSIPGVLQARTLEWGAISFSKAWRWKVKVKLLSRVQLFSTPWTAAYQAPLSMGFSTDRAEFLKHGIWVQIMHCGRALCKHYRIAYQHTWPLFAREHLCPAPLTPPT